MGGGCKLDSSQATSHEDYVSPAELGAIQFSISIAGQHETEGGDGTDVCYLQVTD